MEDLDFARNNIVNIPANHSDWPTLPFTCHFPAGVGCSGETPNIVSCTKLAQTLSCPQLVPHPTSPHEHTSTWTSWRRHGVLRANSLENNLWSTVSLSCFEPCILFFFCLLTSTQPRCLYLLKVPILHQVYYGAVSVEWAPNERVCVCLD